MPVNDTTSNRGYQKPNIANTLADDVGRIRSALDAIDSDMATSLAVVAIDGGNFANGSSLVTLATTIDGGSFS